eukprot:jgi/Botrbrau1/13160/Bobra.0187s0108.1
MTGRSSRLVILSLYTFCSFGTAAAATSMKLPHLGASTTLYNHKTIYGFFLNKGNCLWLEEPRGAPSRKGLVVTSTANFRSKRRRPNVYPRNPRHGDHVGNKMDYGRQPRNYRFVITSQLLYLKNFNRPFHSAVKQHPLLLWDPLQVF